MLSKFRTVAAAAATTCAIFGAMGSANAGIVTPFDGTLTVHYNPDTFPMEGASHIAWVEIKDAVLGPTSPFGLPDHFNYGFNLAIPAPTATAAGLADFGANALTTVDLGPNPVFEFGPHGGLPAQWSIDYYTLENGQLVSHPTRSRAHTVLFGSIASLSITFDPANDGPDGIPDIIYLVGQLSVDDGIYHSINNGEILNQTLGTLTYGTTANFNLIDFSARLVERGPNITGDGLNFWDGSGTLHVPEPGTLAILGLGLAGLGVLRRRKALA